MRALTGANLPHDPRIDGEEGKPGSGRESTPFQAAVGPTPRPLPFGRQALGGVSDRP